MSDSFFRNRQSNPQLDTDETIVVLQMNESIFAQYAFNTHAIRIIFVMRL
jgi:hypothetical protein